MTMEIRIIGAGERLLSAERILSLYGESLKHKRLIVLPVPTSKDKKYITGTAALIADIPDQCSEGVLVAGYEIPAAICTQISERGGEVCDAGRDEKFLSDNAALTANGALGRILVDFLKDISDLKIGIIGYGRIGSRLAERLLFLGAEVFVFTGNRETRLSLSTCGIKSSLYGEWEDLLGCDLVINTAPARLMPDEILLELLNMGRLYDLASGNIFPKHPSVEKLSGLPEKMYPITAGRLYAEFILRHL